MRNGTYISSTKNKSDNKRIGVTFSKCILVHCTASATVPHDLQKKDVRLAIVLIVCKYK